MKKTALITLILSVASTSLLAQVPPFISYQSRVTDSSGVGLGTGTPINRVMRFSIYSAATGGSPIYSEQQTVTLANGEYSVLIGNGSNVTGGPFNTIFNGTGDRYLGVTVDNGSGTLDTGDVEISPRQRITSTAYSFRARSADSIATGSDLQLNNSANYGLGYYGTNLNVNTFGAVSVDGPVLYGLSGGALGSVNGATKNVALRWDATGNVTVGSLTSTGSVSAASVKTSGTSGYTFSSGDLDGGIFSPGDGIVTLRTNNTERFRIDTNGNVGIGTTTPGERLVIVGSGSTNASAALQVFNSGIGSLFFVRNDGNVGIGTNTPKQSLDVAGAINIRSSHLVFDSAAGVINWGPSGSLFFRTLTTQGSIGGYADRMAIDSNGNVGIGTNGPAAKLHVSGGDGQQLNVEASAGSAANKFWRIYTEAFTGNLEFRGGNVDTARAALTTLGVWTNYSDSRLKFDVSTMDQTLRQAMKLRPVHYRLKALGADSPLQIGFIAQEVQEIAPEVVVEGDKGMLSIAYAQMVPIAIGATQQLKKEKDAEVKALREENTSLLAQLAQLQAEMKAKDQSQDAKIAALEKMMQEATRAASVKISTPAGESAQ